MNKGRKTPLSLWCGGVLVALLFFIAIAGPAIAPFDITDQERVRVVVIDGKEVYLDPIQPPNERHWLGTDRWGYDLLTKLMYGARYTLGVAVGVALIRVLLGILLGLGLGLAKRRHAWWESLENAWSYIPLFLPVYFLFYGMTFNTPLSPLKWTILFVAVMAVLGLPSTVSPIRQNAAQVQQMPYVLAARSLGAGRWRLAFRHVLPALYERLLLLFVTEIIAVLTLMGQLGMFDIFVGGTVVEFDPPVYHSRTHEWAGLIGQYRDHVFGRFWIFLAPLGAYVFAVASFHLLAHGLEKRMKTAYQRPTYL